MSSNDSDANRIPDNKAAELKLEPDVICTQPSSPYQNQHWTNGPGDPTGHEKDFVDGDHIYTEVKLQTEPRSHASGSAQAGSRDWGRDLFDSFKDVHRAPRWWPALSTFCCTCFRVPCMMCDIAHSLGDKVYLHFIPGTGAAIRFKVRILGGIQGSISDDCLVTSCCCPCAVCQMYSEMEAIGLGPK
ncbi:unnamed protein product [Lymnaea stagnalis]|uniref:Uncharacterized protein n=1 Tax=Lymnaea stagnalis TaxID=6523 RepID=A0AAV2IJ69_LYMST